MMHRATVMLTPDNLRCEQSTRVSHRAWSVGVRVSYRSHRFPDVPKGDKPTTFAYPQRQRLRGEHGTRRVALDPRDLTAPKHSPSVCESLRIVLSASPPNCDEVPKEFAVLEHRIDTGHGLQVHVGRTKPRSGRDVGRLVGRQQLNFVIPDVAIHSDRPQAA
jgi:hypothetical protein